MPITAALLFGLATLVVPSIRGGSIAVSMTGLTVSVNAPSRCGAASNQRQVAFNSPTKGSPEACAHRKKRTSPILVGPGTSADLPVL